MRWASVTGVVKNARDFFGGEPAHFAQGKRRPCFRRERRMTAGKDEPQSIVLDGFFGCFRAFIGG
jgi:hypothetical protein